MAQAKVRSKALGAKAHGAQAQSPPQPPPRPSLTQCVLRQAVGWALMFAAVAAIGGGLASSPSDSNLKTSVGKLLARQVEAAAQGKEVSTPIAGGRLLVVQEGGRPQVVVEDLPSEACVSAAARLSHTGIVSVNGNTPVRVSASRLSQLCYEQPTARLGWWPK